MLGEIVHNEHVIETLKAKGLRVVQTLEDVPPDATVFVASGASTPEDLIFEVVRRLEARAHRGSTGGGLEPGVPRSRKERPDHGREKGKDRP